MKKNLIIPIVLKLLKLLKKSIFKSPEDYILFL